MTTSASPITATVPNKLIGDHRSDLLLVGLLKAAGIPAIGVNPGWKFDVTTSVPGTLTSVPGKETTVFTWVPTPVPPTAEETQIAALQATAMSVAASLTSTMGELATANKTIATMTAELSTANAQIATLTKQLAMVTAHDTAMIAELAAANVQVTSLTKQITAAESTLKPAPATTNAGGSTAPTTTGATVTTAPASTPAA